jgi:large subunit ribosomal protein L9
MKVILLQELKGRGGEGDVIEVARGFAVNDLVPQQLAIEATSGNLKQLEQRRHNIKKREDIRLAEAGDFRAVLDGKKVNLSVKVGEAGRLFGSVTAAMIAQAISEQLGIEVDRRKIETHGAIKTVGVQEVEVSVYRDIKAHLTVEVVAEGAAVEASEEEAALAAEIEAAKAGTELPAAEGEESAEPAEEETAAAAAEAAEATFEPEVVEADLQEQTEADAEPAANSDETPEAAAEASPELEEEIPGKEAD